jgi:hypothetical protein
MCEDCGKTQHETVVPLRSEGDSTRSVVARVPQGLEAKINVRLLPAREIVLDSVRLGCQPRQGAPRRDAQPVPLPEGLGDRLKEANRQVVAWLARDVANATRYMADPLTALGEAGVELSRAELKALGRTHQSVREAAMVPPGLELVGEPTVKGVTRGKVGDVKRADTSETDAGGTPGC